MLMWLRMAPALHLIFLLIIHRVSSADWIVKYRSSHICALKDSSVTMSCIFKHFTGQIRKVFWTKDPLKGVEPPDLSEDPEYSQRLQYLGDKQQNCTVRLSHVTKKDEHDYYFRIATNKAKRKWIGKSGVRLSVTDLQLESPERVTEGDSVRLTCKSSCKLTDTPTFIWYRNSERLMKVIIGNKLIFNSVSRKEAGNYSCGVQKHKYISPAVYLDVRYAPDTPVISICGSAVIISGDSVTLNCSSDSNPPAEISWFKGKTSVGSGRIFSISKISSDDSKKFKCRARNDHGEKYSDPVTLDVQYPPRNISVSGTDSGQLWFDSVSLMCISDANPPALNFSWFKENQSSAVGSGQSFSAVQSGRFYCEAHNPHGAQRSDAVTVTVQYAPKKTLISVSPCCVIMSKDSVTLSCSSDSNPPALNFSWFKGETFVGSGRIFNISKISSDDGGEYKCKARNDLGEKYSDPVTLNVQFGFILWSPEFAIGVFLGGGSAALLAVLYICLSKRKSRRSAVKESAISDTYAALDLQSTNSDLYNTLTSVQHRPAENSYSTLDPQSSSEHHNPPVRDNLPLINPLSSSLITG
ncbi:B-cell receptor CD22-like [Danio aesculapii]|uniref:B-cell receptor CD22-like n=1 Tax=Danio aesculapii TaxID=1142201 RepID=UPI0024C0CFF0|nr:B-cell receptor CD22-like [Danio aesculapii]